MLPVPPSAGAAGHGDGRVAQGAVDHQAAAVDVGGAAVAAGAGEGQRAAAGLGQGEVAAAVDRAGEGAGGIVIADGEGLRRPAVGHRAVAGQGVDRGDEPAMSSVPPGRARLPVLAPLGRAPAAASFSVPALTVVPPV